MCCTARVRALTLGEQSYVSYCLWEWADELANLEALIQTGGSVENAISRLLPS